MSVLAFGVGLVTIAFSFWGCLRGKLNFTRKKLQWFDYFCDFSYLSIQLATSEIIKF